MGRTSVIIDLIVNSRDAAGDMDQAAKKWDTFGGAMEGLAAPAGIALGAIGGLAMGAANAAADMEQALGGTDAVFQTSADVIHQWAQTSAESTGLASADYEKMAAGIGGALTGMGTPLDQAAQSTTELIQRSADLASVFGGTTTQAAESVTSAFRGEYDSLQRLIPTINAASVEHKMAEEAAAGMTYATEEQAKAAAITNLIMDESAKSAGNFAKESDTASGAQAIASAKFKDTAAALGEQLLPMMTALMEWFTKVGDWVSQNIPLVTTLVTIIGGLAAAVLLVNGAMAAWAAAQAIGTAATAAWTAISGAASVATGAFATAMAALSWPVLAVVAAIAAVIAIVVLLITNWDTVKEVAGKCWDFIKEKAEQFWGWLSGIVDSVMGSLEDAWNGFKSFMSGLWDGIKVAAGIAWEAIKTIALGPIGIILKVLEAFGIDAEDVWEGIKTVAVGIWEAIKKAATTALDLILKPINAVKEAITWTINKIQEGIRWASQLAAKIPFIGGFFSAPVAPPQPTLRGVAPHGTSGSGGGGGGITINVQGALDPVAVARQINSIIVKQNRRQFGVALSQPGFGFAG